jgi:hypothetical protein
MTITAIFPTEAPVTSQRSTFDDRIEQLWAATAQLPGQAVTTAAGLMAQLASVQSDAPLATAAARLALGIADTLAARGDPETWQAAPASYDYPDTVLGSDGITYRCIGTGVVGEDPVGSVSGDWAALDPDPVELAALLSGACLVPGWSLTMQGANPAAPTALVWSRGVQRYRAAMTWMISGAGDSVPDQVTIEYSRNAGATYIVAAAQSILKCHYAAGGELIGLTWAAGWHPFYAAGDELVQTADPDDFYVEV